MKIIFITREGYALSGARVRCYNFAKALKKYGIGTKIFSFADNLGAKYGEKEFEMGLFKKVRYNLEAYQILKKENRDTLIFMQRLNYHSFTPVLLSSFRKHKIIFDCDDWNIRQNPRYILGIYPTSKAEFLTRKMAKRSRFCLAASRFLENYLSRFNRNVFYLPTGVDSEVFNPALYRNDRADSKVIFSWIGTVYTEEMKENLKFIIDCFLSLNSKYSRTTLEILGEGRYFEKLRGESKFLKGRNIIFKEWLHPDKIPEYLCGVDIGLLPLIRETKFNQAKSPTKLFEYMVMEKPVIASFIGEPKEIICDGKTGFLAGNKEEFVRKMEVLVVEQGLRTKIGFESRREILKKYSLNVLGEKLYNVLSAVV